MINPLPLLPLLYTVSLLHMNLQNLNFQRCKCVSSCPVTWVHTSGVHCHVYASSTSGCTFGTLLHSTVYNTIIQYLCSNPRMSRIKCKTSSDVASTAKKCLAIKMETIVKIIKRVKWSKKKHSVLSHFSCVQEGCNTLYLSRQSHSWYRQS